MEETFTALAGTALLGLFSWLLFTVYKLSVTVAKLETTVATLTDSVNKLKDKVCR